jgi:hypothetical protein
LSASRNTRASHRAARTSTVLASLRRIRRIHGDSAGRQGKGAFSKVVDKSRRDLEWTNGEGEKGGLFGAVTALAETDWILADDLTFNASFFLQLSNSSIRRMDMDPDSAPESLFRPAKRRKFIRRRPGDDSDTTTGDKSDGRANAAQSVLDNENDTEEPTRVVRLRRLHTTRKGGIEFSATSRLGKDDSRQTALGPVSDPEKETVQDMSDRFTGNSGQTVDVDRHMYGCSLQCAVPGRCRLTG